MFSSMICFMCFALSHPYNFGFFIFSCVQSFRFLTESFLIIFFFVCNFVYYFKFVRNYHLIMCLCTFFFSLRSFVLIWQTANGQRKLQSTTSLSIPSADDDMIDITPRNQNYSATMASTNFERQGNLPPLHSSSYTRDRELNDAEGKHFIWY